MREYVSSLRGSGARVESAELVLVGFSGYQLDESLQDLTAQNAQALEAMFAPLDSTTVINVGVVTGEDVSATQALRIGVNSVLKRVHDQTDIVLDVSSLPRVAYLALMTSILNRLIPDKAATGALFNRCECTRSRVFARSLPCGSRGRPVHPDGGRFG